MPARGMDVWMKVFGRCRKPTCTEGRCLNLGSDLVRRNYTNLHWDPFSVTCVVLRAAASKQQKCAAMPRHHSRMLKRMGATAPETPHRLGRSSCQYEGVDVADDAGDARPDMTRASSSTFHESCKFCASSRAFCAWSCAFCASSRAL